MVMMELPRNFHKFCLILIALFHIVNCITIETAVILWSLRNQRLLVFSYIYVRSLSRQFTLN